MRNVVLPFAVSAYRPNDPFLAGATKGKHDRLRFIEEHQHELRAADQSLVVVDLSGIAAVSSSYIKETLVWLVRAGQYAAGDANALVAARDVQALDIYPVVTGLTAETRTEVETVADGQGVAVVEAVDLAQEAILRARILGRLERAQDETLHLVVESGTTTATDLHQAHSRAGVTTVTAWNNRLVDLHRARLVRRVRAGRQWIYVSLFKEFADG